MSAGRSPAVPDLLLLAQEKQRLLSELGSVYAQIRRALPDADPAVLEPLLARQRDIMGRADEADARFDRLSERLTGDERASLHGGAPTCGELRELLGVLLKNRELVRALQRENEAAAEEAKALLSDFRERIRLLSNKRSILNRYYKPGSEAVGNMMDIR